MYNISTNFTLLNLREDRNRAKKVYLYRVHDDLKASHSKVVRDPQLMVIQVPGRVNRNTKNGVLAHTTLPIVLRCVVMVTM